jgi:hypothetical protein
MSERPSLGFSSIAASEYRPTAWERVRKFVILGVAAVLLAIFFAYLTGQVQMGTARATNPDRWDTLSE